MILNSRKFIKKIVMCLAYAYLATSIVFPKYRVSPVLNSEINFNEPIVRVVDLNIGESVNIILHDGSKSQIKLLGLQEELDPVFNTLISTRVKVEINGEQADLISS